jgi:hypothetical protein
MGAPKLVDITASLPTPAESPGVVAITSGLASDQVIRTVHETGLCHLVQKDGLAFDSEVRTSQEMLADKKAFLDDPLKVIFGGTGQSNFSMTFDAGEKKTALLTAFGDYVAGIQGSRTIWDQALLIADELYTNGSKNAWPAGSKLFHGPPVHSGTLDFFAQIDGQRLVFGCRDTFGNLDVRAVVARIWTCFDNGVAGSIRHGVGGAGIGSYMVFDSCISYYAAVDANARTVVCVSLPLGLSRRAASGLPKNIHLIP